VVNQNAVMVMEMVLMKIELEWKDTPTFLLALWTSKSSKLMCLEWQDRIRCCK
jgi:hypothetical protein